MSREGGQRTLFLDEWRPREITKGIRAGPQKIKGRGISDQDNVHKYTVYGIMNLIHLEVLLNQTQEIHIKLAETL